MASYIDILREWEYKVINPYLYENINIFFPEYGFIRMQAGSDKDHWASSLKLNLTAPKVPAREKTVIYQSELCFREQGDWYQKVPVIEKIMCDHSLGSIYEAYRFVADKLGLDMPATSSGGSERRRSDERLLQLLEDYFCWNLWNNTGARCTQALAYLRKERGFSLSEIKSMRLGFVPAWSSVKSYVTKPRNGFSEEDLKRVCGVETEEGWTNVGSEYTIAIPYRAASSLKGFLFRSDNPLTIPKYRATKALDRKSQFFNVENSRDLGAIIVVEGELDALSGTSAGIDGMVAIGGSELSGDRNRMLFDVFNRNVAKITLCLDLDTDEAGRPNYKKRFEKNRRSILEVLNIKPDFRELYIAEFTECTDPDKFIRTHGAEAFKKHIDEAKPWWVYLYDHMEDSSI